MLPPLLPACWSSYSAFLHSSPVVMGWFMWMSWLRCTSFCGMKAVHGCSECDLTFTLLLPQLKCTTHHLTVLTSTVLVSRNVQEVAMNGCYGCYFFPHGGSQFHTFASSTLPCQAPLCQIAPLLPSVNNKIGGITFTAALIVVFFLASVAESFRIDLWFVFLFEYFCGSSMVSAVLTCPYLKIEK